MASDSGRKAGRGDPIITEEKVREFLQSKSPPLAGTTQIAEHFDVARVSTIERLESLEDRGVVGKRKVGQSYAWYLTDWRKVVHEPAGPSPQEPQPEPDGIGTFGGWVPIDGLAPAFKQISLGLSVLALVLLASHAAYDTGLLWPLLALAVSVIAKKAADITDGQGEFGFGLQDIQNHLEEGDE